MSGFYYCLALEYAAFVGLLVVAASVGLIGEGRSRDRDALEQEVGDGESQSREDRK